VTEVDMLKVQSSNIAEVGYSEETSTLYVTFKNGGMYAYFEVPKEIYNDFLQASSLGSYFFRNIKGAYACEKLNIEKSEAADED